MIEFGAVELLLFAHGDVGSEAVINSAGDVEGILLVVAGVDRIVVKPEGVLNKVIHIVFLYVLLKMPAPQVFLILEVVDKSVEIYGGTLGLISKDATVLHGKYHLFGGVFSCIYGGLVYSYGHSHFATAEGIGLSA